MAWGKGLLLVAFTLVAGAASTDLSLLLPGSTALTAATDAKVQEICSTIGLCLPLKGTYPPPPGPSFPPPPAPTTPGIAPGTVPVPAPGPSNGCTIDEVVLGTSCATICNLVDNPYIGRSCPDGSICTQPGDSSLSAQLQPNEGILAMVGQATNLLTPVNCTSDADCTANTQFCAANSYLTSVCLDILDATGAACYVGGSTNLRSGGAAPAPSP